MAKIKRLTKEQKAQLIGKYFFKNGMPSLRDIARHFDVSESGVSKYLTAYIKQKEVK